MLAYRMLQVEKSLSSNVPALNIFTSAAADFRFPDFYPQNLEPHEEHNTKAIFHWLLIQALASMLITDIY